MTAPRSRPLTHLVLLVGVLLRVVLGALTPPHLAYDNHFEPIDVLLGEGRLPKADDCWQCYHPPLFYVISAVVFRSTAGISRSLSGQPDDPPLVQRAELRAQAAGHKAVQFVSVVAGSVTLYVCLLIVRIACRPTPRVEALAVALPALLPQHIYMSAMVTNDALTYLMASLAIYAVLRAHAAGWPLGRSALAGALGGACVLSKAYGLLTALLVVASPVLAAVGKKRPLPTPLSSIWRAVLAAAVACVLTGMWPAARNLALYGRPHVDNFELYDTGMRTMPPGSVGAIDFFSLRLISLMKQPWVHSAHVNSFWTELYARFWFDYEGLTVTLRQSREWAAHRGQVFQNRVAWTRQAWNELLRWTPADVPADFASAARLGYLAGLPLTLAVLGGALAAARRAWGELPAALLVLHLLGCLFIPMFQTLRMPCFAAMKAAFALSALSSAAACLAFLLEALRGWAAQPAPAGAAAPRWIRRRAALVVELLMWLGVLGVLCANLLYVAAQYARVV